MNTQARGPPEVASNGVSAGPSQRSHSDSRDGRELTSNMTRAQRFEDEKKRIIESCFSRRDEDGAYSESYITHIRITEDGASPSAPPPPNSGSENKKPRIIIVAVKRTGRVRMHKAKENVNGSFSIGKTWSLDDLTAIESFTGPAQDTYEDKQRKRWAGDSGVIVTIQKPYYWQTATPKEKDFFIGSLVKIYQKYTGGKLPRLTGFTEQELAQFTALPAQRPRTPQTPGPRPSPGPQQSSTDYHSPPPPVPSRGPAREMRPPPSNGSSSRRNESEERGPSMPGQFPQSEFVRNLKPQDSRSRFQDVRSESPTVNSLRSAGSNPPSPGDERSLTSLGGGQSVESLQGRQASRDGPIGPHPSFDRLRNNGRYSPLDRVETPPQPTPRSPDRELPTPSRSANPLATHPRPEQLPERKRPPISIPTDRPKASIPDSPQEFSTPSETSPPHIPHDQPKANAMGSLNGAASASTEDYFGNGPQRQGGSQEFKTSGNSTTIEDAAPRTADVQNLHSAMSQLSSPTTPGSAPETPSAEEVHRPGLGPMIKKKSAKDIANAYRKAAMVHNAFKPRSGGAAEKLREEMVKSPNTPDGINGVFTPSLLRDTSQDSLKSPAPVPAAINRSMTPDPLKGVPNVTITSSPGPSAAPPQTPLPGTPQEPNLSLGKVTSSPGKGSISAANPSPQDERRRKRRSNHSAKYAKALGIDHVLLEGRTGDFESALMDFGWGEEETVTTSYEELYSAIKKDLVKVETGSWLGSFEHNDERVATVGNMLDKAIAECEELDGLLTLYNVELGTLSEDVAYIEAQSQGLQVQTANQRLLYTELQNLLETITISSTQLQVLRDASLAKPQGVQVVETALTALYKAMIIIDPKLRQSGARPNSADDRSLIDPRIGSDRIGTEVSTMRVVQEKKARYREESVAFIQRFKQHMSNQFREAETETLKAIESNRNTNIPSSATKLDLRRRDQTRAGLWVYSPLMLFAREIDSFEWEELLRIYEGTAKKPYQDEYRDTLSAWKRIARKPTGEDQAALFTTQEKESESLVARKLTVKRTKTLREGSRNSNGDKPRDGRISGYEAFAGALYDMSQSIFLEQNFLVDLFYATSLETAEFPDVVAATPPDRRKGGNLGDRKLFDPDRNMAKRVQNTMDDMYSFWPAEVQGLVDWIIKQDALQAVGVMFAIETKLSELEDSNQEFLVHTLTQVHSRLVTRFERFIEEQIRGIEDTKVKIKKRKGVIAFMKTFPYFSALIEVMLPVPRADTFEIRQLVNEVYIKINKAMFESLKFIAKESPVVMAGQKGQGQAGGDAEDKEVLNYHILLIENMNHYIEEVDVRHNPVLIEWRDTATHEMTEHMDLYLSAVIRRPLGKLLDFVESTESLLANTPSGPTAIATRASHSRATFKKLLATFDAKEVRRGIETLKKRVEKHFGDADDPGLSRNLVQKVLKEAEDRYLRVHDRTARIVQDVYEGGLEIEFRKEDVSSAFRRG